MTVAEKSFKTRFFLLTLVFVLWVVFCCNSGRAFAENDYLHVINPVYRHLFKDQAQASFQSVGRTASLATCYSFEDLKETLNDRMINRVTSFQVHLEYGFQFSDVGDILNQAMNEIFAEDDYLAFSYLSLSLSWSGYQGSVDISFVFEYLTTYAQEQQVSQKVNEVLFGTGGIISNEMSEAEKERKIHDWIVLNVAYDTTYTEYSAYAALFLGRAVCQGYSLLTYKMMREAGIEARIVDGEAMNHSWNMVNICGNWYHLDVTWDDPVPDEPGRVLYSYYNLSDAGMIADHTWPENQYPSAPSSYEEGICANSAEAPPASPTIEGTMDGTTVAFSWSAVANADNYILFYAPYPTADSIGSVNLGNQTSISVNLWSGAAFYVAVQASNAAGNSGFSDIVYFIIP